MRNRERKLRLACHGSHPIEKVPRCCHTKVLAFQHQMCGQLFGVLCGDLLSGRLSLELTSGRSLDLFFFTLTAL